MTLIVDTAPLVAFADRHDAAQQAVRDVLRAESGPLVIPAPVAAEADYLLGSRLGRSARLAFLRDLASGRFVVESLLPQEYQLVSELEERYDQLDLGLADCATVVIAARLKTRRLLTFDHRDFDAVRPLQGGSFELLPEWPRR